MGNAEEAQRLYADALAAGPQTARYQPLYHAALAACCTAIRSPGTARHAQLVLLERASVMVQDLQAAGLRPTADTHHLHMACAAYAQQLPRAWDIFMEHLVSCFCLALQPPSACLMAPPVMLTLCQAGSAAQSIRTLLLLTPDLL